MFRFKLGLALGYALGWLVTSGKASELVDQYRNRGPRGALPSGGSAWGSAASAGAPTPSSTVTDVAATN